MDMYVAGEVDRVEIIYHHFKSMGVQSSSPGDVSPH